MIQSDENDRFIMKKKWHVDVNDIDSSRQRNMPGLALKNIGHFSKF